ncbi:hypothetical protein Bca52824_020104 [Brassica carinata]|uniref:Uncharacterized protein n=1 Tax=Brassica carinata TaxID=52824 RepID=A0A8X7VTP9_BRACI|nr:hypothetical protein Bca52824_020104 [Brassica carinata]
MLTGTVNLRWSAGNISHFADDLVFPIHENLDVLNVYNNGRCIRLPRFWQEAFEAAYEELSSDVPDVVEATVSEIARMSIRSVVIDPPPVHSTNVRELTKTEICGQRKNDSSFQTNQPSVDISF